MTSVGLPWALALLVFPVGKHASPVKLSSKVNFQGDLKRCRLTRICTQAPPCRTRQPCPWAGQWPHVWLHLTAAKWEEGTQTSMPSYECRAGHAAGGDHGWLNLGGVSMGQTPGWEGDPQKHLSSIFHSRVWKAGFRKGGILVAEAGAGWRPHTFLF